MSAWAFFGIVIAGGLLIVLTRLLYAKRPWRNDYTTFVWWAVGGPFGEDDIPVEDATFDQLIVRKVRVRPLKDGTLKYVLHDANDYGFPSALPPLREPWLPFTPEEQRLHDLLMQQLRIWWNKEQERTDDNRQRA